MIDLEGRRRAASLLEEFTSSAISNEEYEQRYPKSESDPALEEIFNQIWFLYSDIREHKLTGKHTLNAETSAFVERCILFLRSGEEFEWPRQRIQPLKALLKVLGVKKDISEPLKGDESVWPFLNQAQYDQVFRKFGENERTPSRICTRFENRSET